MAAPASVLFHRALPSCKRWLRAKRLGWLGRQADRKGAAGGRGGCWPGEAVDAWTGACHAPVQLLSVFLGELGILSDQRDQGILLSVSQLTETLEQLSFMQ